MKFLNLSVILRYFLLLIGGNSQLFISFFSEKEQILNSLENIFTFFYVKKLTKKMLRRDKTTAKQQYYRNIIMEILIFINLDLPS